MLWISSLSLCRLSLRLTLPSKTCRSGANCRVPEIGASYWARFQSVEGGECRRFSEGGVEKSDVRRMKGVRPEDADSVSISGHGSENRTRFFDLFGVDGGVEMP